MLNFLLGVVVTLAVVLLVEYVRRQNLTLQWWGWLLTGLALAFAVFTVATIMTLIQENAAQAAGLMGLLLGLPAVIAFILLGRFVFAPARKS